MRLALTLSWLIAAPCLAGPGGVKSVFLNGIDISSARSQELKNVDVMINEQGDIFLIAPHYQVNEEDTYIPLSKYAKGLGPVTHKPPQGLPSASKSTKSRQDDNKAGSKPKNTQVTREDASGTTNKDTGMSNIQTTGEDQSSNSNKKAGAPLADDADQNLDRNGPSESEKNPDPLDPKDTSTPADEANAAKASER